MNDTKYIGYAGLGIANTMSSSGLCRVRCVADALNP
jgi:hypothetical protein